MPSREEVRQALEAVTGLAVSDASGLITDDPFATRDRLLVAAPEIVSYYSDGTAALAVDHYEELRYEARVTRPYNAAPVVELRRERIRRGVLWSVEPIYGTPDVPLAEARLAEVIQYETANPFRDTIVANVHEDPAAVGWQRHVRHGACDFCTMLADRGAVYRANTARFASHPNCNCTAAPVFDGQAGPEASAVQYVASQRRRTPRQRETLRNYLAANYGS